MKINRITQDGAIEYVDPLSLEIAVDKVKLNFDALKQYLRYVNAHKHAVQIDKTEFKKYSTIPARTGLGKSRLPRATLAGLKSAVVGLPHARGGRRAVRFSVNYKKPKLNKKQVKQSILMAFLWVLSQKGVYIVPAQCSAKTKDLVKTLKSTNLLENRSLVVADLAETSTLIKAAKNMPNVKLLTATNNRYSYLIQGFRPHVLITTQEYLKRVVSNYFNQ